MSQPFRSTSPLHDSSHALADVDVEHVLVHVIHGQGETAVPMPVLTVDAEVLGFRIVVVAAGGGIAVHALVDDRGRVLVAIGLDRGLGQLPAAVDEEAALAHVLHDGVGQLGESAGLSILGIACARQESARDPLEFVVARVNGPAAPDCDCEPEPPAAVLQVPTGCGFLGNMAGRLLHHSRRCRPLAQGEGFALRLLAAPNGTCGEPLQVALPDRHLRASPAGSPRCRPVLANALGVECPPILRVDPHHRLVHDDNLVPATHLHCVQLRQNFAERLLVERPPRSKGVAGHVAVPVRQLLDGLRFVAAEAKQVDVMEERHPPVDGDVDEEAMDVDLLLHVLVATSSACPAVRCPPCARSHLQPDLATALVARPKMMPKDSLQNIEKIK